VLNLGSLVGEKWLDDVRDADPRRAHPLQHPLVQRGDAWSRWRETFDTAVSIVTRLVPVTPARGRG